MNLKNLTNQDSVEKKQPVNNKPHVETDSNKELDYRQKGFSESGDHKGNIAGLKVSLHKVYQDYKKNYRADTNVQTQIKGKYQTNIDNLQEEVSYARNKIEKIEAKDIPEINTSIAELREDIAEIRRNPKGVIGDDENKASFVFGGIILLFLTLFLFVFYTSASYSAFFKQFEFNDIGVVNSIFDPKALANALNDGITELLLIVLIPFVFLGLGFLIHKFRQQKGIKGYASLALIIFLTLMFDLILAYDISEKIYNADPMTILNNLPEFSPLLAITKVSFWLIIFSGFVVYIIWGFVFDFFIKAYSELDKVKVAIKEKMKKIVEEQKELATKKQEIETLKEEIKEKTKEINNNKEALNKPVVLIDDLKAYLNYYFLGWLQWMENYGKSAAEKEAVADFFDDFMKRKFSDKKLTNN